MRIYDIPSKREDEILEKLTKKGEDFYNKHKKKYNIKPRNC